MGIAVHEPLWLILVLPVIAVLFLFVKQGVLSKEKRLIMIIRCLTFLLLITALTDPYLTLPQKGRMLYSWLTDLHRSATAGTRSWGTSKVR
ncbi:hypothetical protein ACPJHQ_10640 [Rossellomorea sp. H39__3]